MPILWIIHVKKRPFLPCLEENPLNSHSIEERRTGLLSPSNQNVALPPSSSLILPFNNYFVFTPLNLVLGLTRGVIYSTKDPPPHGHVSKHDSKVSSSSVKSVTQPLNFNMEIVLNFFFSFFFFSSWSFWLVISVLWPRVLLFEFREIPSLAQEGNRIMV